MNEEKKKEIQERALQFANELQESLKDPETQKKAEEHHRKISRITYEELYRPFTI